MSRNPSISLTEHQQKFIADLIASGRFSGVSEVMRAGLRLLEEREEARQTLLRRLEKDIQQELGNLAEPIEAAADTAGVAPAKGA